MACERRVGSEERWQGLHVQRLQRPKQASPNDDFPLPHIDVLVDNTAEHKMLSFIDGFSGYNQIRMAEEDMEKTSFITL